MWKWLVPIKGSFPGKIQENHTKQSAELVSHLRPIPGISWTQVRSITWANLLSLCLSFTWCLQHSKR